MQIDACGCVVNLVRVKDGVACTSGEFRLESLKRRQQDRGFEAWQLNSHLRASWRTSESGKLLNNHMVNHIATGQERYSTVEEYNSASIPITVGIAA